MIACKLLHPPAIGENPHDASCARYFSQLPENERGESVGWESLVADARLPTFSCQPSRTALAPSSGLARPLYMYFISMSCSSSDSDLTSEPTSDDFVMLMMSSSDMSVVFWWHDMAGLSAGHALPT